MLLHLLMLCPVYDSLHLMTRCHVITLLPDHLYVNCACIHCTVGQIYLTESGSNIFETRDLQEQYGLVHAIGLSCYYLAYTVEPLLLAIPLAAALRVICRQYRGLCSRGITLLVFLLLLKNHASCYSCVSDM